MFSTHAGFFAAPFAPIWGSSTGTLQRRSFGNTHLEVLQVGYDAANQLTNVKVAAAWKAEFAFDGLGRRRLRRDYAWTGSAWNQTNEVRYVYDGMLVIQERDASNNPLVGYTRGRDLSGGLEAAGGIGGLLARSTLNVSPAVHHYYHADAGGNVTALVNASQGLAARYEYDPFGNVLLASGPMADVNLYRFSSKEFHPNAGLYYYGYRFYDPYLQRWVNPDPIGEMGGINLYGFVGNGPTARVDGDGLFWLWDWIRDYFNPPYSGPNGMDPEGALWSGGRSPSAAASDYANAGEEMGPNDVPTAGNYKRQDDWRGVNMAMCALANEGRDAAVQTALGGAAGKLAGAIGAGAAGEQSALKMPCPKAAKTGPGVKYFGKLDDLQGIPRSQTLLDDLPNLGNPRANYYQNSSVLRKALRDG